MSRTLLSVVAGLACWALLAGVAGAVEAKLSVEDSARLERKAEPVTSGVPFAKGAVKDVAALSASAGGKPIPAQLVKTVPWDDGSVRWALLDTQADVPAGGKVEIVISDAGKAAAPAAPVKVEDGADAVKVSTGPMEFTVSKKKFSLFESLKVDGKELLTATGKGIVVVKEDGGELLAGPPAEVTVENAGPMRATVCLKGRFPGVHGNLLGYTVRLTAYAGQKLVKVHVWFENDGGLTTRAPGRAKWFRFDGLALDFGLGLGEEVEAECEGAKAAGKLRVGQYCSPGHDWKSFSYKVTSGAEELKKGERTDGVVSLSGGSGKLSVAVRHFWEQYEKAIELDGANLKVWLWPVDGEWPRTTGKRGHDSEEYPEFRKAGFYHLSGGTRKGHETILDFSGRGAAAARATLAAPLLARAEPAYYALTEAAPGWFAPADFKSGKEAYDKAVGQWTRCTLQAIEPREKPGSLNFARQGGGDGRGSWHGWMDFGDNLWAEGYSSLHYDWTWMMLLNFLRTGDRGFFDMGLTMARHRIDVDQIWTGDSEFYSGLTRYEKCFTSIHGGINDGHYGPIPSHNWTSGMALYYMLTGEPQARECCFSNHAGMKRRLIDRQDKAPSAGVQTRELGWSILNLCSLYDLTAEKKYLDDAMILFDKPLSLQWKEKGPYLQEGLQYYYSTQGLCELHHRTGNENVMKLLREGCAGKFPENTYNEWPIFLSNIYAYVGYKDKNEAYVARAEELFAKYAEITKNLGCYTANGAWDKESGKLIRNGHILQYVEWKLRGGK